MSCRACSPHVSVTQIGASRTHGVRPPVSLVASRLPGNDRGLVTSWVRAEAGMRLYRVWRAAIGEVPHPARSDFLSFTWTGGGRLLAKPRNEKDRVVSGPSRQIVCEGPANPIPASQTLQTPRWTRLPLRLHPPRRRPIPALPPLRAGELHGRPRLRGCPRARLPQEASSD